MSPAEINRLIADKRGIVSKDEHGLLFKTDNGYERDCPNCHGSLDACAEFERTLDKIQRRDYVRNLYYITGNEFGAYFASAPQRCRAFLTMHGNFEQDDDQNASIEVRPASQKTPNEGDNHAAS